MDQPAPISRWCRSAAFFSSHLYPRISATEFKAYFAIASMGGFIAGVLGAFHDLWTYSIGPEYFTKVKFNSFWFANFGLGNRPFAATVGFLAAGCVGFFVAWFLARRFWRTQSPSNGSREIAIGFVFVFLCVIVAESLGYAYGIWRGPDADYAGWFWAIEKYHVKDVWSFVRVAYIHNSAYLGVGIGLTGALFMIRPTPATLTPSQLRAMEAK